MFWNDCDDALPVCVDLVLARWTKVLAREGPWRTMPRDDVSGEMRRVVIELANAGWEPDAEARRHRVATAAREHGVFRRAQGCSRSVLAAEFALVRSAITGALRSIGWCDARVQDAVNSLVPDIRLARQCAERGFLGSTHRTKASAAYRR